MMCPPCDKASRHGRHCAHTCDETNPNNGHGYTCTCPCTLVPVQPDAGDDIVVILATTAAAHMPVADNPDAGPTSCSCGWLTDTEKAWDLGDDWPQYLAHLATTQADAIRGLSIDIPLVPATTGATQ